MLSHIAQEWFEFIEPVHPRSDSILCHSLAVTNLNNETQHHLPSQEVTNMLIKTYETQASSQFPSLHLPTLNFNAASQGRFSSLTAMEWQATEMQDNKRLLCKSLYFAILAVGAVYESLPDVAYQLATQTTRHILSELEASRTNDNAQFSIQTLQALYHLIIMGTQLGDARLQESMRSHRYALVNLVHHFRLHQSPLPDHKVFNFHLQSHRWYDWVRREESKRLYLMTVALLGATCSYINDSPSMVLKDVELELPVASNEWDAETNQEWDDQVQLQLSRPIMFRLALRYLAGTDALLNEQYPSSGDADFDVVGAAQTNDYNIEALSRDVEELDCAILGGALNILVHRWRRRIRDCNESDFPEISWALTMFSKSSSRWYSVFTLLKRQPIHDKHQWLSATCVSFYTCIQMSLQFNTDGAKAALQARDFKALNSYFEDHYRGIRDIGLYGTTTFSTPSPPTFATGQEQAYISLRFNDNDHQQLLQCATEWAVAAIESQLSFGPWETSDPSARVGPITALSICLCLHMLGAWSATLYSASMDGNFCRFFALDYAAVQNFVSKLHALRWMTKRLTAQQGTFIEDGGQIVDSPIHDCVGTVNPHEAQDATKELLEDFGSLFESSMWPGECCPQMVAISSPFC